MKRSAEGVEPEDGALVKRAALGGPQGDPAAAAAGATPGLAAWEEQAAEPPSAAAADSCAGGEGEGDDEGDEALDQLGIPRGWRECPAMGTPVDRFVPMKVPLGARFDGVIAPQHRFSVKAALDAANALVAGMTMRVGGVAAAEPGSREEPQRVPAFVGVVFDLTKSSRYYDAAQWRELGVQYIKIPCAGHGEVPQPSAVSDLCCEMYLYLQRCPQGMALIHCTHGFNRTGYMIASYLARTKGLNIPKALRTFAEHRPPGIYKQFYVRNLFRYYHESLPAAYTFPAPPAWKAGDLSDDDDATGEGAAGQGGEDEQEQEQEHMQHDDILGEEISPAEEGLLRAKLVEAILGPEAAERSGGGGGRQWLPGSQPVSLDASNQGLLGERQYWVTWKADGTRYMLLLLRWGTYLVDRKFTIRRVQMRWPTALPPGAKANAPTGPPHHWTILDGEMVVDELLEEGRQERRFLAYDLVMDNGRPMGGAPFLERYRQIQKAVIEPRQLEQRKISTRQWAYPYQYSKEAFRVRRKEFWPLSAAQSLIHKFIPQLCHEADGLIFQGAQDPYVPGTCQELLKWKFAHMNSVDFRLRWHAAASAKQPGWAALELLETRKDRSRGYHALEGAQVEFPEGEDPAIYHMRIIECAFDPDRQVWVFMRERRDKDTPNATHVYESVARSIHDNIKEEQLLEHIEGVLKLGIYDRDCGRTPAGQQQQQQTGQQQQQLQPA